MRNLITVINQILEVIPEEETNLIDSLHATLSHLSFDAPEIIGYRWDEVHNSMCSVLPFKGEKISGWKLDMVSIFTGETK